MFFCYDLIGIGYISFISNAEKELIFMEKAEYRRQYIKNTLLESSEPVTASQFAEKLDVSRQIIVGDVAILRASGLDILATPRGYTAPSEKNNNYPYTGMIACIHDADNMRNELYTIVDFGATVIDVTIEHTIYGELSGMLNLSSRYDVDMFMEKVEKEKNSTPISALTGGVHLHKIGCRSKDTFERIKSALTEMNIAIK